jgi:choline dehydrogenase-like flavoprotein
MLLDAQTKPDRSAIEADICVIGAGPAGITLALELEHTGARVVVLESGGSGWTLRGKVLTRGENGDPNYPRLDWTRLRMFGGSSWAWRHHGLRTRPLEDLDFEDRPEIGRQGWPFGAGELTPYWGRAAELCRLPARGFGTSDWERPDEPALPATPDTETVMFPVGPGDAFTKQVGEVRQLRNVRCLLNATALELITAEDHQTIERVSVGAGPGQRFDVRAKMFAVAMGGIENARLLLLSHRGRRSALGNEYDQLGRYFMEHPHVRTGVFVPRMPTSNGALRLYEHAIRPEGKAIAFLRLTDEALRREHLLSSAWALHPSTPEMDSTAGTVLTDLKSTARIHLRTLPHTSERVRILARHPMQGAQAVVTSRPVRRGIAPAPEYRLLGMIEQEPNPASRVTLGTHHDRYGQPVARLDWRLSERDLSTIRRTQDLLAHALERAGVGTILNRYGEEGVPPVLGPGFHHMGTTRMSTSPSAGVVDADGRVHGTRNLYVAGSSVFPTSGFANPTLTLVALTLRLAEHLRGRLEPR